MGADVATSRIDTDTSRDYGRALDFWTGATAEHKDALLGLSDDLLRIAIGAARRGQLLAQTRARARSGSATAQDQRRAIADAARRSAKARRNQLYALYTVIIGGDPELSEALAGAYGSAAEDGPLVHALIDLSALGRRLLANTHPGLARRRDRTRISTALLAEVDALAADFERRAAEAGRRRR